MQVQGSMGSNKYSSSVFSAVRTIYAEEGLKGCYRGVGPALITVPLFWAVYWPIYNNMKIHLSEEHPQLPTTLTNMLSAISAGAVGDVITNPFWVCRTRIQTLALHPDSLISPDVSTAQMMRLIYEQEGFRAFYKGLGASFLGLSHVAIQFPLYEYLKKQARQQTHNSEGQEGFAELVGSSMFAKLVASTITYPHEVLRARLQDAGIRKMRAPKAQGAQAPSSAALPYGKGVIGVLLGIIRTEGVFSLWSGLRVNLVRIVPATGEQGQSVTFPYVFTYPLFSPVRNA
ncbi:mitochondrial carrier domain-containing protein [Ochromonadaceae sp. CCMP2298]|nr:mitochondrial carrier domain-containing protein [Ochromonadaceae sp. CCMP2298]